MEIKNDILFRYKQLRTMYNKSERLFLYAVQNIQLDMLNDEVIIYGWGLNTLTKRPLNYSLGESTRKIRIETQYLPQINKSYQVSNEEKLGFVLHVEGIQPVEWLVLSTQEGIKLPVKLPATMNRDINYSIDSVKREDDSKTIVVRGWGFDNSTKEKLDLFIINKNSEGVTFKREMRNDVNSYWGSPLDKKYGFEIIFDESWFDYKNKIKIKFRSKDKEIVTKVDIRKSIDFSEKNEMTLMQNVKRGYHYLKENGLKSTISRIKLEWIERFGNRYEYWIEKNEIYNNEVMKKAIASMEYKPKISVITPVYNVEERLLIECIESVQNQSYENWELCLVDDNSSKMCIKPLLEKYMQMDDRIKCIFREENGHISVASNDGLKIATGEYIALLDNDDVLASFAFYEIIRALNEEPDIEFIYSDEDKIDTKGNRSKPFFKPDWSPDTLLSQNYICHLSVIKKTLVDEVCGFAVGLEGAQDYDLILKCTEKAKKIRHIPQILYHWRTIEASTAENPEAKLYAFDAGRKAIENALERRRIKAKVYNGVSLGTYVVQYAVEEKPNVSIIIPTKDHSDDLKKCIDSVIKTAEYDHYEIIIVDNGSKEEKTFTLLDNYTKILKGKFSVLSLNIPFNYSKLNNEAVKMAKGDYIVLLNNDIEILTKNWIEIMLGYSMQAHIGAVGAKLYYPDNTIQHAGVVLGVGGVAGHSHKGYPKKNPGYFSRLNIPSNYGAVTAAFLMINKRKFLEVGGLDEVNLAVAFNDVDLCIKLLEKKYFNVWLPQIEAYHYESKSRGSDNNGENLQRFLNENIYMKERWGKYLVHDPYYSPNLTLKREDYSITE
ncbi:glycosyltransferase family 2 protein [Eubacterium limosum]|uniref:glycosyltransferase family 2 protein n=1 Tax=Eubacterium limosum TaxID=1736 RepID=UPI003722A018